MAKKAKKSHSNQSINQSPIHPLKIINQSINQSKDQAIHQSSTNSFSRLIDWLIWFVISSKNHLLLLQVSHDFIVFLQFLPQKRIQLFILGIRIRLVISSPSSLRLKSASKCCRCSFIFSTPDISLLNSAKSAEIFGSNAEKMIQNNQDPPPRKMLESHVVFSRYFWWTGQATATGFARLRPNHPVPAVHSSPMISVGIDRP